MQQVAMVEERVGMVGGVCGGMGLGDATIAIEVLGKDHEERRGAYL
jgi:hypothetical protein